MHGENINGIEIKYDKKSCQTDNLYIETAEKSDAANPNYVPSGIFKDDNSWAYAIGDYVRIYVFSIKQLRFLYHRDVYKRVETPTSQGFLLPLKSAENWSLFILKERETI